MPGFAAIASVLNSVKVATDIAKLIRGSSVSFIELFDRRQ
jgi:hypothetical protein